MDSKLEIGIRPEFIKIDQSGFPINIQRIDDVGRYRVIKAECEGSLFNIYVPESEEIPNENVCVRFDPQYTHVYCDGWIQNNQELS